MENSFLYAALCLLTLFIFVLLQRSNSNSHKNLPPSPLPLPLIGHLHLLKPPLHRSLHHLSRKHGPVFALCLGSRRAVVVSSPVAATECFTTNNDVVLANRPRLLTGKHIGYNYTIMSTAPYGDHWLNLRRVASIEIFSSARLKVFSDIWSDEITRAMLQLRPPRAELKTVFSEMTFNMVMRMVAGKRYYGEDAVDKESALEFRGLMKEIFSISGVSNPSEFMPFLNWFSSGYEKRVKRLANRTDLFLQDLIDEARRKREGGNTMIHHLLSFQESQSEYYTDEIIKGFTLTVLLGGADTTAVTLEWAMSNLLNHPHILEKAKSELDTQVGQEKFVEEQDLSKLPYLQSIICETLRLYPTAPLLLPHYSSEDCTINGYDVPQGTIVLVNAWAINRNPDLWEDAESFKPERFETSKDEVRKLLSFGMGRRACPGAGMAQRLVGLSLGRLIQCFEWERVSEQKVDMTEGKGSTMPKVVPLEANCMIRPIMNTILLN